MDSEAVFQELQRYVRWSAVDAILLAALGTHAAPEFPRIAVEFYERIREHEDAHSVLKDEAQVDRLQRSLVSWCARICGGPYDSSYAEQSAEIGRVHVRVGLPQRYMFGAMSLLRAELSLIADATMGEQRGATHAAIDRVLDIELGVMMEAYQEALLGRVRRIPSNVDVARTSEHAAADAAELAPLLMVGVDLAGVVRFFNREAEHVSELARDEIIGRPFLDLCSTEETSVKSTLANMRAGGEIASVLTTRSGKSRHVEWCFVEKRERAPHDVALFAMGRDVTHQKERDARTQRANRLAATGTLAAGLAHELRNPLNGARLALTSLKRAVAEKDDSAVVADVVIIDKEMHRLSRLVADFLEFARPKMLDYGTVGLRAMCEQVIASLSESAASAGVDLVLDLPIAPVDFWGDAPKLLRVLENLVRNAVEARAASHGKVTLRARRQPRLVVIEVEDDGDFFPSDAPIFDAFYSTKQGHPGLGLPVAHRIVSDHHGTLDAFTASGRTTFRVALPLQSQGGGSS